MFTRIDTVERTHTRVESRGAVGATPASTSGIFSLSHFPSACRTFIQSVAHSFSLLQFPSACRTFLQTVAVSFSPPHKPTTATFHDLSISVLRKILYFYSSVNEDFSVLRRHVDWYVVHNVSKQFATSIFSTAIKHYFLDCPEYEYRSVVNNILTHTAS